MSFAFTLILFLGFRIIDWLISYLAPFLIPYLGFFPLREILPQYNLPKFLTAFANFDGAHYLIIATSGYFYYQQAFFPLYPLLIRFLSPLFLKNHLLTALMISNVSFFLGLFVFSKYLALISHSELARLPARQGSESENRTRNKFGLTRNFNGLWSILFLVAFPTSFFFGAVYTEGLFFLLLIGCLYLLKKRNYLFTIILAFLASLTRLVGLFLFIPILLSLLHSHRSIHWSKKLILLLSPITGVVLYSSYLFKTTGDPLFFLRSQWAFGAHRTSNPILLPQVYFRYLKIFFTAAWNFQYFISLFEFIMFNLVFIILILDLFKNFNPFDRFRIDTKKGRSIKLKSKNYSLLGLSLFSLVNLLLPTLTGTLSSIPRYALFSLSFFIYLSAIKNLSVKVVIAAVFIIFHALVLGFFIQGYFVS